MDTVQRKRAPKGQTREELIKATLSCIAELGLERCTVRRVAEYAGVTNGLIRFYFKQKSELLRASYAYHLDQIIKSGDKRIDQMVAPHKDVLHAYVEANLSPPVVMPDTVLIWASFLPLTYRDPKMAEVRNKHYDESMQRFERLISDAFGDQGLNRSAKTVRHHASQLFALIDGLWLVGSMYPDQFGSGELREIGVAGAEKLLGLELRTDKA